MVRKTTAQKQAVERELRELKKGLGGEDVLNAMKLVASRGSKLFQNLSRALLKGTLGMDRCQASVSCLSNALRDSKFPFIIGISAGVSLCLAPTSLRF